MPRQPLSAQNVGKREFSGYRLTFFAAVATILFQPEKLRESDTILYYQEVEETSMAQDKKVEQITDMEVDFAQWFTDVCVKAELVDYSGVKGLFILRPYGYAI